MQPRKSQRRKLWSEAVGDSLLGEASRQIGALFPFQLLGVVHPLPQSRRQGLALRKKQTRR